jgi:hypothetical protein
MIFESGDNWFRFWISKREICYRPMTVIYSESPDQKSDTLIGRGFVLKKSELSILVTMTYSSDQKWEKSCF